MKTVVCDTETAEAGLDCSGIPTFGDKTGQGLAMSDHPSQPHMLQLGALLVEDGQIIKSFSKIQKPVGWTIDEREVDEKGKKRAFGSHHITNERAQAEGVPLADLMDEFYADFMSQCDQHVCFSATFDRKVLRIATFRRWGRDGFPGKGKPPKPWLCLMKTLTDVIALPATQPMINAGRGHLPKTPSLMEAHKWAFGTGFDKAHDALEDVKATHRVWEFTQAKQPPIALVRIPDRDS